MTSVTAGPAAATRNSSPGEEVSRVILATPPKNHRSMPEIPMPLRRATIAWPELVGQQRDEEQRGACDRRDVGGRCSTTVQGVAEVARQRQDHDEQDDEPAWARPDADPEDARELDRRRRRPSRGRSACGARRSPGRRRPWAGCRRRAPRRPPGGRRRRRRPPRPARGARAASPAGPAPCRSTMRRARVLQRVGVGELVAQRGDERVEPRVGARGQLDLGEEGVERRPASGPARAARRAR